MAENYQKLILPDSLISPTDLSKTLRELENLDDFLRQSKVRAPGNSVTLPKTSQPLHDLTEANNISLLDDSKRQNFASQLKTIQDTPTKIHISFASSPSIAFLRQVIVWIRKNINSLALVEVGLQPSIAAGCIVRTENKVFDLSLRNRLNLNREMLSKSLGQTVE